MFLFLTIFWVLLPEPYRKHLCCWQIYAVCDGTLDISLSFFGHFILVCLNSKQAPVESLYWTLFTFSGLGYTKILRFSGLKIWTKKSPIAKLIMNMGILMYLRILIVYSMRGLFGFLCWLVLLGKQLDKLFLGQWGLSWCRWSQPGFSLNLCANLDDVILVAYGNHWRIWLR